MDRSDVITLITQSYSLDSIGQEICTETELDVYCNVSSVSASEWFSAGEQGMQAAFRVTMFAPDYTEQTIVKYRGKRYAVYRTYRGKNDLIELYLRNEVGVNG